MLQKERRRASAGYANEQLPLRLPGAQSFWGPPNSLGTPPLNMPQHRPTRQQGSWCVYLLTVSLTGQGLSLRAELFPTPGKALAGAWAPEAGCWQHHGNCLCSCSELRHGPGQPVSASGGIFWLHDRRPWDYLWLSGCF